MKPSDEMDEEKCELRPSVASHPNLIVTNKPSSFDSFIATV